MRQSRSRKIQTGATLAVSIAVFACSPDDSSIASTIIDTPNGRQLILSESMESALAAFDPHFSIRETSDYPQFAIDYWRQPGQAMFAALGDFNADGIQDAVLDGESREYSRRLAILSKQNEYFVVEVMRLEAVPKDRDSHNFTNDGLGGIRSGKVTSRVETEPEPLLLKGDGFVGVFIEKGAGVYYYRDGALQTFFITD